MFAAEEISLNTLIHPRTCIGCYEYASLDLSRHAASIFGFNMFSLRLFPIIYGLLALLFFYQILNRWVSNLTAIITTGLLAVNPIFLVFQHQLNVSIITFTSLMFCILGFHLVDKDSISRRSIWIFALACAAVSLHYQVGRYCMLGIILFWCTRGMKYNNGFRLREGWILDPQKRTHYYRFVIAFFIILSLLHPFNLFSLLNTEFLSPRYAEHIRGAAGFFEAVKTNLPLILHSIIGTSPFYGDHSTDLIVSIPYKLLNVPLLVVFLIGILGLFKDRNMRSGIFLLALLFLTSIPIALSLVIPSAKIVTTLNPFRMFYMLIPFYMLIAIGLEIGISYLRYRKIYLVVPGFAVALTIFQFIEYRTEAERFNLFLSDFNCQFTFQQSDREFDCELPENYKNMLVVGDVEDENFHYLPSSYGLYMYREHLVPLWQYAQLLSKRLEAIDSDQQIVILNAPVTDFKKTISSYGGTYKANLVPFGLALYLAENGVDVNYAVPYHGRSVPSGLQSFMSFLVTKLVDLKASGSYRNSKHITMPLYFDPETNEYEFENIRLPLWERIEKELHERNTNQIVQFVIDSSEYIGLFMPSSQEVANKYHFVVRSTNWQRSNLFLVTTESEKRYIVNYLDTLGHPYVEVSI